MSETDKATEQPRSIERELEINAPVEAVWKALTDAEELTRWFPLEARVTPGAGGSMWMSWRNEYQHETPIEIWEPNKRLRLIYCEATPADAPEGTFRIPFRVTLDYYLEGRGGKTVLRLVHSGFGRDAIWDAQYDGTCTGWDFMLGGLKHYLERHRGTPRRVVSVRSKIPQISREDAWKKLFSAEGLLREGDAGALRKGAALAIRTSEGDELKGSVSTFAPPHNFCAMVSNLNDAWLRVQIDELFGKRDVTITLGTFGVADVDGLEKRFRAMLARLFGSVEN
jgi:uncharacterized protein YndB with AHSA1/START domain